MLQTLDLFAPADDRNALARRGCHCAPNDPPARPAWGWGRIGLCSSRDSNRTSVLHVADCRGRLFTAIRAPPASDSVTICRELRHSDQLITFEHGGTDRLAILALFCALAPELLTLLDTGRRCR